MPAQGESPPLLIGVKASSGLSGVDRPTPLRCYDRYRCRIMVSNRARRLGAFSLNLAARLITGRLFLFSSPLGRLAPSAGGHIIKAEVVWVAVAGLRLIIRALELVLLTATTRLRLQLLVFLTSSLLLLATLATLLVLLFTFFGHQITPCCRYKKQRCAWSGVPACAPLWHFAECSTH
jgi:hypothetical protein